ncbi:toll/interleukin-1 receptor domain-containing protein [Nocardioides marmoriginsengisoli]|uniref:toll/interleukin-1 receptor domain-containing protein n=1 Tax=Nocardioides marmoriginsengisoli TaxID=661483 RepID=UPI00160FD6B5|nr:TIR domain-containing protein [Nocardioides marmoriginsengisoli]
MRNADDDFEYDVALSFAGEQREYVAAVATELRFAGLSVFYDEFEIVRLWGKDLSEHLDYVYNRAARFCVIFASSQYAEKAWTTHERRSAQARALESSSEYILPARFDSTAIPGLRSTVQYVDLAEVEPTGLANMIAQKVGRKQRKNFVPPVPDLLWEELGLTQRWQMDAAARIARSLVASLNRFTTDELHAVTAVFVDGCKHKLPENIHVQAEVISRELNQPIAEVMNTLGGLRPFGVQVELREMSDPDAHPGEASVNLRWGPRAWPSEEDWESPDAEERDDFYQTQTLPVLLAMFERMRVDGGCLICHPEMLDRLDFSGLSSELAR